MYRAFRGIVAVLPILIVAATPRLQAQAAGGHAHAGPHGGAVVEVAEHHVEFTADSTGKIAIWVLNEQMKPTAPPPGGSIALMPEGAEQVSLPLKVDDLSQSLVARFDPRTLHAFQAVVSLTIEGKRHNFRFHYPAARH
ncbi:MAG: hypothetical protein SGJ01_01750 [Gemmatimonadota bacterium]|nr:hypothetical protein [Gemmatimonadota bacterium]